MKSEKRYVVVGLGGVGGIVLRMLTAYLRHRGERATVCAIDGDDFEERNRDRQFFSRLGPKAQVLAEELTVAYGDTVTLLPIPQYLDAERARELVTEGDVVFCTPDNHATRHLLETRCRELRDAALFSGGNDGVEDGHTGTYGNAQIYLRKNGRNRTNALSTFHPEIAADGDALPSEEGCAERVAAAPQLLFANLAAATAILGAFYAWEQQALDWEEVYFDVLTGRAVPVKRAVEA